MVNLVIPKCYKVQVFGNDNNRFKLCSVETCYQFKYLSLFSFPSKIKKIKIYKIYENLNYAYCLMVMKLDVTFSCNEIDYVSGESLVVTKCGYFLTDCILTGVCHYTQV
jgi:hypothetical protein